MNGGEFRVWVVCRITELFGARTPICDISTGSFHASKIGLGRAKGGDTDTSNQLRPSRFAVDRGFRESVCEVCAHLQTHAGSRPE